jgi:zinc and cadmium transporter
MEIAVRGIWIEAGIAVLAVQCLAAAAVLLAGRKEARLRRWLPFVVSIAVGVLLATGTVHLLPDAVTALGNRTGVWLTLTLTILGLFCFERAVHVFSGVSAEPATDLAEQECEEIHHHSHAHGAARPSTLLLGSFTHSLVDGTSIGAAFAVNPRLGWVTALAVGLHEVPHRLGDFALLLHMDVQRGRAARLAILAGLSSFIGWGVVAALGAAAPEAVAWLLPVSAGSFLYISLVDLLPELFQAYAGRSVAWQIVAIALGVALAVGLTQLPGA